MDTWMDFGTLSNWVQEPYALVYKVRRNPSTYGLKSQWDSGYSVCLLYRRQQIPSGFVGVLPTSKTTWEYVEDQRRIQFQDLKRSAVLIYTPPRAYATHPAFVAAVRHDASGIEVTAGLMVRMLLIQLNRTDPCRVIPFRNLEPIASCFLDICDSATEADAFWLFKFFAMRELRMVDFGSGEADSARTDEYQQKRMAESINNLWKLVQQQDHDLSERLHHLEVDLEVCCESWYFHYFADVLPPESLERIWDVLFGGAPAILDYVALCLILAVQRQIQAARGKGDVYNLLRGDTISNHVNHQAVVSSAIDLWEKPILDIMSESSKSLVS
ncbi:hypothetical protein SeMB42_g04039 [Synchytrium endobioticum]|uniref:TBC1 domain family member 7 n=1 Tax=Synchytrium endobioticum TaxID=286115 RepID=A0A507D281_9FUNG|nr:hypothetical protein SeMB42_g04039 [Synchytrium endobioticum]